MTKTQVLRQLKAFGTPQNRKVYARHGVKGPVYGVSYANLGKLTRRIKIDHELALGLWKSGNHDARILATMIADPDEMSARDLDAWVKELDNHALTDALSALASRTPSARKRMEKWTRSRHEWIASCGWDILARLVQLEDFPDSYLERYIRMIQTRIHRSPNRVRHSMNNALIALGSQNTKLQKKALSAAKKIGEVVVDHGETGCRTPDASGYIRKIAARRRTRRKK